MRNILSILMISFLAFGLVANEASAKRFGGGRSFGVFRSNKSFSTPAAKTSSAMGQRSGASRWGGVLGGLLIGGLLASLFMHNGLAGGLLSWLLVGAVILFAINFFRRRMQPGYQSMSSQASGQNNIFGQNPIDSFKRQFNETNSSSTSGNSNPVGFNADEFLREAKGKFIRLQAAYDQKNLADISEFTTPEVFAEIQLQFQDRGNDANQTEVVTLEADLLDVVEETNAMMASVKFTGLVKEEGNPTSLDEIWHFRKYQNSSSWIVSGVQQGNVIS
jgi:predicted lipid-binding transport protein (Tim44 family)